MNVAGPIFLPFVEQGTILFTFFLYIVNNVSFKAIEEQIIDIYSPSPAC